MKIKIIVLALAISSFSLFAADKLNEVKVSGVKEKLEKAGTVKDVIIKTEVITEKKIEKKQSATLSEAVDNEVGIQTSTGCSMCGMKRIRINGMKGEHTTVLIDDVPMHSTVSSYYGMDALTTAGIASIEVARGSGSSLIAPGAIGGVVNIKSKIATEDKMVIDAAVGNEDYKQLSILATNVCNDGKTRATITGQYNNQDQWDADDNGVNESPEIENYSTSAHVSHDITENDNIDVKLNFQKSDVFGGPMIDAHHLGVQGTDAPDEAFVGNNVNNDFNGNPLSTLEAIVTKRAEATVKYTRIVNDRTNVIVAGSGSKQTQDSVYEGADYYSEDDTYYADVKANYMLNDQHLLTAGFDTKQEKLRAESYAFFSQGGLDKDDFDMSSFGFYLQDVWNPMENLEVSGAIRFDKINVDWTAKTVEEDEIDEFVAVPRLHVKWMHNDMFTSRFSAGMGYRAPLTFFESEHGVLEDGFGIEIEDIEKSMSAGYSFSADTDRLTSTLSANFTQVENLAIITDEHDFDFDGFALVNSDETHNIITIDGVVGYQLSKAVNAAVSYEHYMYNDEYKAEQFLAQVEDRAKFMLDFDHEGWLASLTGVWTGGRDLTEYGYEGYDQINDDGTVVESSKKDTDAPAYFTMDAKISKAISDHFTLYIGAKNLLDYTQAGDDFSPLMYDADGGYDVGYIWGPLRGRQVYSGIRVNF
jgi:outer membrane receptor for ferrienterochelin and colicin